MFCPKCGQQVPGDENFCMKCGADLGKYKETSGGGVSTGDVGMIKDSHLESASAQQQASIHQAPVINIQLGEILRESVLKTAEGAVSVEQVREVKRLKEVTVSVKPEVAELLKKAKYATSDEEAERYYDQILEMDIENDVAWYQKFLLRNRVFTKVSKPLPSPRHLIDTATGWKLVYETATYLCEVHDSSLLRYFETFGPTELQPYDDYYFFRFQSQWDVETLRSLKDASAFFGNAVKAAPDQFDACSSCSGRGFSQLEQIIRIDQEHREQLGEIFSGYGLVLVDEGFEICPICYGMGQIRVSNS